MFHKLVIKDIVKETDDAVSLVLQPENGSAEQFRFKAGQYLTFRFEIDRTEVRRSYSICAAPHENVLKVMVKEVPEGLVSVYINRNLKIGDVIESMAPTGRFTVDLFPEQQKNHIAIAAGSGITPIISMIKEILFNEHLSSFKLFYGNKNYDSIIFRDELIRLEQQYGDRFAVHHFLSREQVDQFNFYGGRLTREQLEKILNSDQADEYYLCGPEPMINTARDILSTKKIPQEHVHFELFTTTEVDRTVKPKPRLVGSEVRVKLDGIETTFQMKSEETVLNAAIDEGLDVPYACQGGTCCTCQAKLLEGNVTMDVNMVLTDKELEQGYILTCQSHPTSEHIVIDYDAV